ncbi:MAG TPA: biotin/lipoyl-containing protein [Vicinamibacteria bacterium]|nr:biotin/lipoyl-containing protein [Vicinamibacteria bacterium]
MLWRCGEEAFDVELRGAGEAGQVRVDGQALDLQVDAIGGSEFVARRGSRRETFHCARDGGVVHLFWRGRTYRLEPEAEGRPAAHRHVPGALEAPMPGKVIAVKVAAGDTVGKGDELLVVEAMKMENAVRAPRDGRVKSVSARVGDMVLPGAVLVELE